ncbi:sodium:proton antiporter [Cupriavidus sp. USMAA2-4]|uniref:Sodium:proton antiporter n=1 Tax=Cupriavidus malaysiensis TaxID=367825 RepID=A0ABM6F6M6_9BURK|nr:MULTISPECIES: sodium:proton antiporter [Cupriavidus]AOY93354.1 sodium:proton antiporter [Cupriavidus sp. USMAA2-4]AOZ07100.1 sodium:proton antiporter [Cupriavidus malaysiensis]
MRRVSPSLRLLLPVVVLSCLALPARAADLDGAVLSPLWGVPFAGILLSIALVPLLAPRFWHHHFGKVAAGWGLVFIVPFAAVFGLHAALANALHALLAEYIPFIALVGALYIVAGGICVRGNLQGSPRLNTGILALGTLLASLMGTTGAAMLLIRPLLRANDNRKHVAHVVVFFIFLVANAGGALTPLGDPPLFLGFLKGVDFFWTLRNILPETLFMWGALLAIFYLIDRHYYLHKEENLPAAADPTPATRGIVLEGKVNLLLLLAIIGLVLMSGLWKPGIAFDVMGTEVALPALVRDVLLVAVALASLLLTPHAARAGNEFGWEPILEVGKLFAGIFLTIIPVIAMLKAGTQGPFAAVLHAVSDAGGQPIDSMYFWATGVLSSFLDNAPTYLVFFNTAGGDAATLMTRDASTLAAISAGAVFMGANTYIGNAPNLMVKAIAESRGVRMPGFFGFMAWSVCFLVPLFLVMTLIFFHV